MKKSHNFMIAATGLMILGIGVVCAGNIFNNSMARLATLADATPVNRTLIFDADSFVSRVSKTITLRKTTATGGVIICKIFNSYGKESNSIGSVTKGSQIKFYEEDGTTEYTFEDIDTISFYKDASSSLGFDLSAVYTDGEAFNYSYSGKTTTPRNINFAPNYDDVAHLRVTVTSPTSGSTVLSEIRLIYNCTTKTQNGVTVLTEPTQTVYAAGKTFNPAGMVVAATYSNNTQVVTEAYTYETRPLLVTDEYVEIYHHGFVYRQPVYIYNNYNLDEGTYKSTTDSYKIVFNGSSSYYKQYAYNYNEVAFTYVKNGNDIELIFGAETGNTSQTYRYLNKDASGVTMDSRIITLTDHNEFSVELYSPTYGVKSYKFVKE